MARGFRAGESGLSRRPVEGIDQALGGLTRAESGFSIKSLKAFDKTFKTLTTDAKDALRSVVDKSAFSDLFSKIRMAEFSKAELEYVGQAVRAAERYMAKNGPDTDDEENLSDWENGRTEALRVALADAVEQVYWQKMTPAEKSAFEAIKKVGNGLKVNLPYGKSAEIGESAWRPALDFMDGVPPMEAEGAFETVLEKAKEGVFGKGIDKKLQGLSPAEQRQLGQLVNKIDRSLNHYARFDQIYQNLSNRGMIDLRLGDRENPPDDYDSEQMVNDNERVIELMSSKANDITEAAIKNFLKNR